LPTRQIGALRKYLGYVPQSKTVVEDQQVFKNGKNFIVQDRTGHVGGVWKLGPTVDSMRKKATRRGGYSALLNRVGG
jgi:hypothetical protein